MKRLITTFAIASHYSPLRGSTRFAWLAVALCLILAFGVYDSANATPLVGTKSIGPTGDYASISAAITDIQTQTLGGALVLELQAAYLSSVETFPLVFTALGTTAVNTVTLRPQTGAVGLVISSANTTAATVDLNGAQFVTIDGRPGGVGNHAGSGGGAASQLTIANTSTVGVALRFINEASGNTIQYTTLRGVNTSASSGSVVLSTTTGANGNDNNTIDHCDIRDGASTPRNGIYSSGSTGTAEQNNNGNTVSNCNVFNFQASTSVDAAGVRLDGGNTDWTITGNSIYQTASRAAVAANVRAIYVNSGNNCTVTGNFIGGSAPNAGGTAWTTTGTTTAYQFAGIQLAVGIITPSSVQGNTIKNFVWTSSSTATTLPGVWGGIHLRSGSANIGTVIGNTVGSGAGTGSVSVTTSGNGGTIFGMGADGNAINGTLVLANNTVGSITANGSATTISSSIIGIYIAADTTSISSNTIGSTSTANSLNAATSSTSATGQQVTGVLCSFTVSGRATITGNTVANLNNNYAGTASSGQIRGIVAVNGVNTITGNTVRNLSTTSNNTFPTASAAVLGISQGSTAYVGQTISQNVVHSLTDTTTSGGYVIGLYYTGPTTGTNIIARNLVHSISGAVLSGMEFDSGIFSVRNNMVRVGLDESGGTAGTSFVSGIRDSNFNAGRNFYHNTVYVGGAPTSTSASTYAFRSGGTNNAREFRNNIFVNARSNNGATSKHYAVIYGGNSASPNGLTASGNIFFATGTGGVLGLYNTVDRSTLAAWQAATGVDATSAFVDPLLVNPSGTAATLDLHLQASSPAENGGLSISAVTDDFDGQTRSNLTPTDIGADAGNFTSTGDVFAPSISYPLLANGSTANRVLTGWATIQDNSGSVSGGASAPRLYYKKSTDADTFSAANNATGNGWKYVTTSNIGSPYSFTIDYSLINGGSVSNGDTIQYFVVAQDAINNLGSSPAGASASANPPVQNVNGKPTAGLNSYAIAALSGSKTVGSGGDYFSLSHSDGFFSSLNGSVLVGDVVINVISDLTENGGVALAEFITNDYPANSNYTVTIQPGSNTMKTISGTVNAGLITLNGADRVIIDGRFNGTGRYLTFRNTSSGVYANAIHFKNDACNNTVRSSIVVGASFSGGAIFFGGGTVTGNDNNLITDCQVGDPSIPGFVPRSLIHSIGSSDVVANSGNTISNNELFNFKGAGVSISSLGNDLWTITGNDIHESAGENTVVFIDMKGGGTNLISGNSIHELLNPDGTNYGISVWGPSNTTISRNRITAFNPNAATTTAYGIYLQGSGSVYNVVNNQINLSPSTSVGRTLYGIYDQCFSMVNAYYNSIVIGGTESGTGSSWASLRVGASTHTARDNIFINVRTGGTGSHFAAGSEVTGGSYTASNNIYAGTGATAANFMDFSSMSGTPVPMSFATWQSTTGDTNSQAGIGGTGSFTTAMFVDATNGDLHLVPGGNALVNSLGIPIAGVTDDFDGDPRSATTPTIGSDELVALTLLEQWRLQYFGTISNTGNAADMFDFDQDGLVNLVEWGFGLNPTLAASLQLPQGVVSGSSFVISFTQPAGVSGITYGAEWSTTLSNNSADWTAITDSNPSTPGYTFSVPIGGNTSLFVRLKVTTIP